MIRIIIMVAYFISLYFIIFWLLVLLEKGVKPQLPKKLTTFPFVSICIPAYNEEKNIAETIDSVLNLDYPREKMEIIVVNDGSSDGTKQAVESMINKIKDKNIMLLNQKNKGKGAAMNYALKKANGEFFISLDADSIVAKKALKVLLPHFSNKNIAAVLPMIMIQHKSTIMRKIQHCEYLINFFYKRLMSHLNCIHVTPGPFSIYRRKMLVGLGGFDEDNLVEDLEMAVRIQKANYEIVQVLETSILTKAPANFSEFYKQRNRWYKGSLINVFDYRKMVFNKNYGDLGLLQLPMIFISAFISITLFFIFIVWMFLRPLLLRLYDLNYIKFDVVPLISRGIKNYTFLNINFAPMFYGLVIVVLGIIFLVLAHHHAGVRVRDNKKSVFFYLTIYPIMMAFIWIGVLFDLIRGKIQKW